MTEFEMTVTQALVELKTLNDRIKKAIDDGVFILAIVPANEAKKPSEIEESIKASYQKVTDLMARRDAIKDALIQSNSVTTIDVAGKTMTVAVAIDRKQAANELRRMLLRTMIDQSKRASNTYRTMTTNVESNARTLLKSMGVPSGNPNDATEENEAGMAAYKAYIEANKPVMLDPLKLNELMDKTFDELEAFDRDVDVALSVKNAVTIIKGEY